MGLRRNSDAQGIVNKSQLNPKPKPLAPCYILQVYTEFFGPDGKAGCKAPARSAFEVAKLPLGALVEIECVAVLREHYSEDYCKKEV